MAEFSFEVIENCGSLSESGKGWKKEIKLISWNGKEPKYDIREWSPDGDKMGKGGDKMGKGVTLSKSEMRELKKLLESMDLED